MLTKDEQAKKFIHWVDKNYDKLKQHHKAYCLNKKQQFNEDIFCDTYVKIYETILKNGIKDDSEKGFQNYFFMAFRINMNRDKQYAANQKRDENAAENISFFNEIYMNKQLTEREKLLQDLKKDFSCIYLLSKIEEVFPSNDCQLFRIKLFDNLTYKQLADKTNEKNVRQRIINIKNWLKENVTKDEIDNAFNNDYGDLLYN